MACMAIAREAAHVVNADQTVIMIWDEESQMQHFIRQADFKTDAPDVGFVVPSPARPTLAEAGNEAFPALALITAPPVRGGGGFALGCAAMPAESNGYSGITVVEKKRVAGFDATVLTARTGADLARWLAANGYPYSPGAAEWAAPYLGGDWHFTALKVAKDSTARAGQDVRAAALRISFRATRPLFPYREPESSAAAGKLGAPPRLLRIYFISNTRYEGQIGNGEHWGGRTVWSGDITAHRTSLLRDLSLPATTGPANWWLTEFEDRWPYERAAGDVYFARASSQRSMQRKFIAAAPRHDALLFAFVAAGCVFPLRRKRGEVRRQP